MRARALVPVCLCSIASVVATSLFAGESEPAVGAFSPASCPEELVQGLPLGDNFEFGYVKVPEFHANPDGTKIEIAVARFKSFGEHPASDPLVLNNGGPGDSNLAHFLRVAASGLGRAFLRDRDLVIIELRGLPYSKPSLACDEVAQALQSMASKDVRSEQGRQILVEAMHECHDRLFGQGVNLSAYNNVETAADIAMVMTALGYDRFNIFGTSAGTMVAQHVMRGSPERVRTALLNAAIPIDKRLFGSVLFSMTGMFEQTLARCADDEACRAAFPDLEAKLFALVDTLNEQPKTLEVTSPVDGQPVEFVLNGDRLVTWLFFSMYANTQIPLTLGNFIAGDFSQLEQGLSAFFPARGFSYGLYYSVILSEVRYTAKDTAVTGDLAKLANSSVLFFDPKVMLKAQQFWKVDAIDPAALEAIRSEIPTLILNGEQDHVIPSSILPQMAAGLANGHLFIFPGVAHSPVDRGECALGMILHFLADPSQAPDSTCMQQFAFSFEVPADR